MFWIGKHFERSSFGTCENWRHFKMKSWQTVSAFSTTPLHNPINAVTAAAAWIATKTSFKWNYFQIDRLLLPLPSYLSTYAWRKINQKISKGGGAKTQDSGFSNSFLLCSNYSFWGTLNSRAIIKSIPPPKRTSKLNKHGWPTLTGPIQWYLLELEKYYLYLLQVI